ncbi:hypothetical protein CCR75_006158 [Bremia lactucae]|uniref:Uncharacterized protein n=1 Tax=Bremia lactucae TaxID=4779 RepID=A0A976IJJ0_BRELC|nr:hypothetical protein CCR75_006158 [Bremia lactucae]
MLSGVMGFWQLAHHKLKILPDFVESSSMISEDDKIRVTSSSFGCLTAVVSTIPCICKDNKQFSAALTSIIFTIVLP